MSQKAPLVTSRSPLSVFAAPARCSMKGAHRVITVAAGGERGQPDRSTKEQRGSATKAVAGYGSMGVSADVGRRAGEEEGWRSAPHAGGQHVADAAGGPRRVETVASDTAPGGVNWATELVDSNPLLRDTMSAPLMMAVSGYWLSQAIYTATKLGIPDVLSRSGGSMSVAEIAREVGAHPPTLYRLMRSLGGQGPVPGLFIEVFPPPKPEDLPFPLSQVASVLPVVKDMSPPMLSDALPSELPFKLPVGLWRSTDEDLDFAERDLDRRYSLTPLGALLRKDMEGGIRDVTLMSGAEMYKAWGKLEESVRTGGAAFDVAHGRDLWDFYASNPDAAATFNGSMTNLTTLHLSKGSAIATFDFSYGGACSTVCDIGGGQGRLLGTVLQRFPDMQGVLYDQKVVVDKVRSGGVLMDMGLLSPPAGAEPRVSLASGSFFEPETIPKGCDVYTMKHIIHDWDDDDSVRILGNVARAMKPGSHLLLVEVVVEEDNSYNPFSTEFSTYFDLHMLVAVGGAERRPSEFRSILERAGLELVKIHKGSGPGAAMCVVEAQLAANAAPNDY